MRVRHNYFVLGSFGRTDDVWLTLLVFAVVKFVSSGPTRTYKCKHELASSIYLHRLPNGRSME